MKKRQIQTKKKELQISLETQRLPADSLLTTRLQHRDKTTFPPLFLAINDDPALVFTHY
jgi:hypothetical protein